MEKLEYESVASIIRSSDFPKSSETFPSSNDLRVNAVYQHRHRRKLSASEFANMMSKSTCRKCGKKCHWAKDHYDGKWKTINEKPAFCTTFSAEKEKPHSEQATTMTFNMANLQNDIKEMEASVGPLVDDGALYSDLSLEELQ